MSENITDRFGRVFTVIEGDDGLTTYASEDNGISVSFPASRALDSVLQTLEAMAPPQAEEPPPAPVVPSAATVFQIRSALMAIPAADFGKSVCDEADAWATEEGGMTLVQWRNGALSLNRNGAIVSDLAVRLSLSSNQLDALFTAAAAI